MERIVFTGVGAKKPEALWTSVFAGFWSIARSAVEIVTATGAPADLGSLVMSDAACAGRIKLRSANDL